MPDNLNTDTWLVGAGVMAIDYVKVLRALGRDFSIIGRGTASAQTMKEQTGEEVVTGGLEAALSSGKIPIYAIVATGVEQLATVTTQLLEAGVKHLLVEKPAGFYDDVESIAKLAKQKGATVLVAYNRRYYAAVQKAKEMIAADGGVVSFNFEFTEWAHTIEPLQKGAGVKEQWLLANSTHVIDLAFYLGGTPEKLSSFIAGSINWHPSASIFSGAGVSVNGALFSYHANWQAPGRWVVEILTQKHRYIFKPMEKLQIQKIASVAVEEVPVDYTMDMEFKPGLFLQVKDFLENTSSLLPTIEEHFKNLQHYRTINFGNR